MSLSPKCPVVGSTPFCRLIRIGIRGLAWCLGGVTVRGAENFPASGSVILAANHRSHMDIPYLSFVTPRHMHFMAKADLFQVPVLRAMMRGAEAFPIRRGVPDRAALRQAVELLKQGRVVTIYPEGTRSPNRSLGEAEKGFALIARQAGAVIVPVALEGTEKILAKGATRMRRAHVTISVGKPLRVAELLAAQPEGQGDALGWIGAETMRAIGEMMDGNENPAKRHAYRRPGTPRDGGPQDQSPAGIHAW